MRPGHLEVTSPDLSGDRIPLEFTCDGSDTVPALEWANVPDGTRSFAIVVDDPDAPRSHFVHWLVWDLEPEARRIDRTTAAHYPQGTNGFGSVGWSGPCPPPTDPAHRYVFRVCALDRRLELPAGADRHAVERAMRGHVLAEGTLVASYARSAVPVGP